MRITPIPAPAGPGGLAAEQLDELVALEQLGTRLTFPRNQEIFAEGDDAKHWYRVVSGMVRICKLLADGRRHIAEFRVAGEFFGFEAVREHGHFAEAVDHVVLMRYPRAALERLAEQRPGFARRLREVAVAGLVAAHGRMLQLGRMTAGERVASFLLDLAERLDRQKAIDLPMSRYDIADYLGLTIETVSRVLSGLRRNGTIAIPNVHRIELLDRTALPAA
jgi:CRP/FNR family nitrogen fixation transcriptional regulator